MEINFPLSTDDRAELPRGLCDLFAVRERRPAED